MFLTDADTWAIIPAYNEGKRVAAIIKDTLKIVKNVVVVDDGSSDDTYNVSIEAGATTLRHMINLGKGSALKTGIEYCIGQEAKRIVVLDADGQHDPKLIPQFLQLLDKSDVVIGYRKFDREMPLVFKIGNSVINKSMEFLFGIKVKDSQSGYRAFNVGVYDKIKWKSNDYSMEAEMLTNIGKNHIKFKEVPIQTIYNDRYKGTTIFDGIRIVVNIFRWRFLR